MIGLLRPVFLPQREVNSLRLGRIYDFGPQQVEKNYEALKGFQASEPLFAIIQFFAVL